MSLSLNFATNNSSTINPLIPTIFSETPPTLTLDVTSEKTSQIVFSNIFSPFQDSTDSKSSTDRDYYSQIASSYPGNARYVALNTKMLALNGSPVTPSVSTNNVNDSFNVEDFLNPSFVKIK